MEFDEHVTSVAYSPDGSRVASGAVNGTIYVWDTVTGDRAATLEGHESEVRSVAYSPDGQTIASGGDDGTVRVWDAASGAELAILGRHENWVRSVAYSPDGQTIASGGDDGTVRVWDAASGAELAILGRHEDWVRSVAYSPDGQTIASGGDDGTVRVWDAASGAELAILGRHEDWVRSVAYSPDGQTIASGGDDGTVRVWDAASGAELAILGKHEDWVRSVAYSPDGQTIASGGDDGTILIWNPMTENPTAIIRGHEGQVNGIAFSPDGMHLASGSEDWTVRLWDANSGIAVRTLTSVEDWIRSFSSSVGIDLEARHGCEKIELGPRPVSCSNTHVAYGQGVGIMLQSKESDGAAETVFQILALDQWISYRPNHIVYLASDNAEDLVKVRFNNDRCPLFRLFGASTCPLYPLTWYQEELRMSESTFLPSLNDPPPSIRPKEIRMVLMIGLRSLVVPYASLGLIAIAGPLLVVVYSRRRRGDPMQIARDFFSHTHWRVTRTWRRGAIRLESRTGSTLHALALDGVNNHEGSAEDVDRLVTATNGRIRLYMVFPDADSRVQHKNQVQQLKAKLHSDVVPLDLAALQVALHNDVCVSTLAEQEELYITREDPYFELMPIKDAGFFFGRQTELRGISSSLVQGQHIGIFGLRKTGKTSLANRLLERFRDIPIVMIQCDCFDSLLAADFLSLVTRRLHARLRKMGVVNGPSSDTDCCDLQAVVRLWRRTGRQEPCVVILDEIDRLLPIREGVDRNQLMEGRRVVGTLRTVAQELQALAVVAIDKRPDISRVNRLPLDAGENPMFMNLKEIYTGSLTESESREMLREIGTWRDIMWDDDALEQAFVYCGGHPLVTRLFASDACRQHKSIDLARANDVGRSIRASMHSHQIGGWYSEMVADMTVAEQDLLRYVGNASVPPAAHEVPLRFEDALTSMEHFGLVRNDGWIRFTAELFDYWVRTRLL